MERPAIHEGVKLSVSRNAQGRALGLTRSWPILLCLFAGCTTTGKASDVKAPEAQASGQAQPSKPQADNAGATNPNPPPAEKAEMHVNADGDYIYLESDTGMFLNIDSKGWAYWSTNDHVTFYKEYYKGDLYLKVAYAETGYKNYYLSYSNNGYVGVYGWANSVAWSLNGDQQVLKVKDNGWKTYEYVKDGVNWIVIGDYNYRQIDLKATVEKMDPLKKK